MVFDASSVLAMVLRERGHQRAAEHLRDRRGTFSTVNLGETLGKLVSRGASAEKAVEMVAALGLTIIPPTEGQARRVGELATVKDLSLADRFCIALGEERSEPIVTADRDWAEAPVRTPLEYFR